MTKATLQNQLEELSYLIQKLTEADTHIQKNAVFDSLEIIKLFFKRQKSLFLFLHKLSSKELLAVKAVIAIGQGENVFRFPDGNEAIEALFKKLISQLVLVDEFYHYIGGIVGYHYKVLKLIYEKNHASNLDKTATTFSKPIGIDLLKDTNSINKYIYEGIVHLDKIGEIYPIGGAGDRLDLHDKETNEPLPTAKLNFLGKSLLEGMIKDLQAKEFLFFKLFDKQLTIPVAMMTSHEKRNHHHIMHICENNSWFSRPKNSFSFFTQPSVPVVTEEGDWSLSSPLKLFLKPGGHGVMWQLAKNHKIFSWLKEKKKTKILVRQINNPIAGIDFSLLALNGIGCHENKVFGFASCYRLVNSSEGVNVLVETKKNERYYYAVSNIEYTDFDRYNLEDKPEHPTSSHSIFPSNTNILFADLNEVEKALIKCPIPGLLINMKKTAPFIDNEGNLKEVKAGRLESTMQNIADYMATETSKPLAQKDMTKLKTFLTFNKRYKTISVTKKAYHRNQSMLETPMGCLYDVLLNGFDLLTNYCDFNMPPIPDFEDFVSSPVPFIFLYDPALGPLYSIIQQKIRKGSLSQGSELQININEIDIENLDLKGSLTISSKSSLGEIDDKNILRYSQKTAKCSLINVTIENDGIDFNKTETLWENNFFRKETIEIILDENAEFHAKDLLLKGNFHIHVPKNTQMVAYKKNGNIFFKNFPIKTPTWGWKYQRDKDYSISLCKAKL